MLGAHNRVTALRGTMLSAWQQVEAAMAARSQALAALLVAVAGPLADEAAAMEAVANALAQVQAASESLRRQLVVPEAVAELSKADAVLAAVLVRLVALAEQQPVLQADEAAQAALKALRELPPRLAFARQMFNDAGAAYNAATQQFPTRLLGSLYRFGSAGRL